MNINKYNVFILTIALIFNISIKTLYAQYYYTGVEPFKTDWKKKEFNRIRLIFPAEADSLANIYLWWLIKSDSLNDLDYRVGHKRLDVVLHPNTVMSNGFVAWAPRRMELVTQPDAEGDATLWHKTLSVHEMRHVKQMYSLNSGTIGALSWIFGQQAVGLAAGFVHPWIFEGDAVWAETHYSFSGRGRSANFFNHYYTFSVTGKKPYSYDKWLLGSYRDYIPNHYHFGYQMVSYINHRWGYQVIPNTFRFVGKYPYTFFPTYFGLKKETGLSRKNIYLKAFAYNDSLWRSDYKTHEPVESTSKKSEDFINIINPYTLNDTTAIAYVRSLTSTPFFGFVYSNGKMERLVSTGIIIGQPSFNDSLIAWAEYKPHYRWEWKSYSVIKVYNFKTKELQEIATGRYHSPVLDQNRIICIEYSSNGSYYLVSLTNGKRTVCQAFESGYEVQQICLDSETKSIYGIAVSTSGKNIFRVDSAMNFSIVYNGNFRDIRNLSCAGTNLFFSFTDGFTENIYNIDIQENELYKIESVLLNCSYPQAKNNRLTFAYYTANGYRLTTIDDFIKYRYKVEYIQSYNKIVKVDSTAINESFPKINFKTDNYGGIKTLVNIHSWFPFYFKPLTDPSEIQLERGITPGITLLSQNLTGTTLFNIGYGYGDSHLFFAALTYNGFWPVFSFSIEQTDSPASLYRVTQSYPEVRTYFRKAELITTLPFTLSSGAYYKLFQAYNIFQYNNNYLYQEDVDAYRSGLYTNEVGITYHSIRQLAHRDLQPKYGVIFRTGYVLTPWDYSNIGNLWYGRVKFYLPGLFINHGLSVSLNAQKQNINYIYLNNKVDFPTGYASTPSTLFRGVNLDYIMPLVYPDYALRSLLYIKRFSLNLFADFATNSYKTIQYNTLVTLTDNLHSVGFEAIADFHLFRTWYPFRFKFTQAFYGNDFKPYSNIALSIDLNPTFARQ